MGKLGRPNGDWPFAWWEALQPGFDVLAAVRAWRRGGPVHSREEVRALLKELRQLYREQLDASERRIVRNTIGARQHARGAATTIAPGRVGLLLAGVLLLLILVGTAPAFAHCDTVGGPVIADAQKALQQKDVTPVLKWLKPEYEPEVRTLFAKTARVRSQGAEAAELADRHFFETVVRLHRAGEGQPYTGLKAEGVDGLIAAADRALASEQDAPLVDAVREELTRGLRERFARAVEARKGADKSVEAGRRYVAAYVELLHYVERLHLAGEAVHEEQAGESTIGVSPASFPNRP